jgi:hypothetical protein
MIAAIELVKVTTKTKSEVETIAPMQNPRPTFANLDIWLKPENCPISDSPSTTCNEITKTVSNAETGENSASSSNPISQNANR